MVGTLATVGRYALPELILIGVIAFNEFSHERRERRWLERVSR